MNISTYFSVKDFLNYYIAGLVWGFNLVCFALLSLGTDSINVTEIPWLNDSGNFVLFSLLALVIPYLIGFALSPISTKIGECIRNRTPDPISQVVDEQGNFPQGLKAGEISLIKYYIKKHFLCHLKESGKDIVPKDWFFQIRALVAQDNSGASLLATRALDLTNLSESLILPLPLSILLMGACFFTHGICSCLTSILAFFICGLLILRYIDLRSYWVKHIYRAFIAMCIQQDVLERE